jgi:hypothetical protein
MHAWTRKPSYGVDLGKDSSAIPSIHHVEFFQKIMYSFISETKKKPA